ncbi:MAG: bifunctional DNA-formamidopyrimidine glycosylase/DNA-(apurinic or apyrimidinic site) lyase [Firmicutes bacterium]|nr:bifunctional DNA-formamidopyrimidine glycosylase/DNA-(apurinic or apyrimidinic site) lyase [Bacillota bacterium]
MPELPEVETIRRYLEETLPGQEILAVPLLDGRLVKGSALDAHTIAARLVGERFVQVKRRGKFLFFELTSGAMILCHLGMSGRLLLVSSEASAVKHTHVRLILTAGELRLVDPRRFGRIAWLPPGETGPRLGVEPLSRAFGTRSLKTLVAGRRASIKQILLDQQLIAGLGNIYADEALFLARIHPLTPAGDLSDEEAARLVRAIKRVLRVSLSHRGTSFSDYVDALGRPGDNQRYLAVYGREGETCMRCRQGIIQRERIGGRSSHVCPVCQPLPAHLTRERGEARAEI